MSWQDGLVISIPGMAKPQLVDGPHSAAGLLAEWWPVTHGTAFQGALKACAQTMEGFGCPNRCRQAFIEAAEEAGVIFL